MDDGFKSGNGICLSTESFTLAEVELKKKTKKKQKKRYWNLNLNLV